MKGILIRAAAGRIRVEVARDGAKAGQRTQPPKQVLVNHSFFRNKKTGRAGLRIHFAK
jgi:hypothetical protein